MMKFNITVSEDKLIAKLSAVYDGSKTKDELVGEIMLTLEGKGIVHGVSESMIETVVDALIEKKSVDEAVVALGDHPSKDNDAGPTFTVPFYSSEDIKDQKLLQGNKIIPYYKLAEFFDAPYIIQKSEVIGVDESWVDKSAGGVDVYGEPITNYISNTEIASLNEGITIDKKNGNIISLKTGILIIHNRNAKIIEVDIAGSINIEISPDKLRVYLSIYPPAPQREKLKPAHVFEKLKSLGIVYGIKNKEIETAFKVLEKEHLPVENVLIAKGEEAQSGTDEKIKYLSNLSFSGKPYLDEKGKANYFKIHIFENVKKEQPLAKIIPAVPGINGKDVLGSPVDAEPVKRCEISCGNNVSFHSNKKDVLIATKSGHVYEKNNKLIVERVFRVDGNVDFRTGDINFEGDVDIKGDVPSGFSVKATGSIVVGGTVEDATLIAEENIIIKEGFVGKGYGRVKAGNNVVVKHVMNQTILAQNDIMISGEAIDSKLYAGNEMFVEIKKSWIIGGYAVAGKKIYANALGNMSGVKTEMFCGTKHFIEKILDETGIEITLLEEEAAEIKEKMRNPKLEENDITNDDEYKEIMSIKLKDIKNRQDQKFNKLKNYRAMLKSMEFSSNGEIGVLDTIYPGVILHIGDHKYTVSDGLKQVVFYYSDEQIKIRPFRQ